MTRSWFIVALLLLGAGAPALATVIVPLCLAELVSRADRIAVAKVEGQVAEWAGDGAIVTRVTLRVEEPVKGAVRAGDRLELLREGGELENIGMRVEGAARFTVGEEVLVFLEQRGGSTWTVGMAQGKLHVASVAGRRMVTRDLSGLAFQSRPAPDAALSTGAARPLDEVLGAIATMRGSKGAR